MSILLNWLISTLAIIISAYILPGIKVPNFTTAFIAALVLGILNAIIRPLLLLLTLPLNILTLGLFTLVINAVIILLVASLVPEFQVNGFLSALLFAMVLSVINSLLVNLA